MKVSDWIMRVTYWTASYNLHYTVQYSCSSPQYRTRRQLLPLPLVRSSKWITDTEYIHVAHSFTFNSSNHCSITVKLMCLVFMCKGTFQNNMSVITQHEVHMYMYVLYMYTCTCMYKCTCTCTVHAVQSKHTTAGPVTILHVLYNTVMYSIVTCTHVHV